MPTMKDIARLAGVSHGTVSNVLNNKGNVSADKIIIVKKAAEELGYSLNEQARQLRSLLPLANIAAVILPNIDEMRYSLFYSAIHKFFQDKDYRVMLYTTEESPFYEELAITKIVSSRARIVISISCFISDASNYEQLRALGVNLIFVERNPPGIEQYFGYNYSEAGFEVGSYLKEAGYKSLSLLMGLDYYSHEEDFQKGVIKGFGGKGNKVNVFSSSYLGAANSAFDVIAQNPLPDAIVCSNEDLYKSLVEVSSIAINEASPVIYTLSHTDRDLKQPRRYVMNYANLGLKCADYIYDCAHKVKTPQRLTEPLPLLKPDGFRKSKNNAVYFHNKITLNLLMASSSSTRALIRMSPEFTKAANIRLNFVVLPLAELTDSLILSQGDSSFDIVRTNVTTTPNFSASALTPMDRKFFDSVTKTMLKKPVQYFSYIDDKPYAVPFDFNMYFQVYHRELFNDAVLSRRYFEANGRPLAVPENYDEYNSVVRFFTRKHTPVSPVEFGTTAIINENTTIVYDFYRRYLSYGGEILNEQDEYVFSENIALKALKSFLEMMKYSIPATDGQRKDIGIHNLLEGKTALEIASTAHTSELADIKKNRMRGRIGFACTPLPWHSFGGGALAIPASCKHKQEALAFIEWACGEEQSLMFTRLGGLSPHKLPYANAEIMHMYPWYNVLYDVAKSDYQKSFLDKADRYQFERLLGVTLRNVYHNVISPESGALLINSNIKDSLSVKYTAN